MPLRTTVTTPPCTCELTSQIGFGSEWGAILMDGVNLIGYAPDVIASQNAVEPGAASQIS